MAIFKAILGPTNTGKTHYAIERMMAYSSGMIGLPLRLLAREVYDKIVAKKGGQAVALITGEERIEPASASYYVCTTESMPVQREVEFLAVDEIQLAEDRDRGHIFTERILNARGQAETLLLGSETMRLVLVQLDIGVHITSRERFSRLIYGGALKISRLPKRTAVIGFSADEVYSIAEFLRQKKGAAAIVMGALSPRTRNAQVALYQSGEVDYIVATDAIGMGLNLDVDYVAFSNRSKFDGRYHRSLTAAECGQIAGRAGRFRNEGLFGETSTCPPFDTETVTRIEEHNFEPIDALQWRNSNLNFSSIDNLIGSLSAHSQSKVLHRSTEALDEWVLRRLNEDGKLASKVNSEAKVRRVWDLVRLPDFRRAGHDGHARLVLGLIDRLLEPDGRIPDHVISNWLEDISSNSGGINKLQERLAAVRTWSYVAHRNDWLENPYTWRQRVREIEDSLSDALHQALTARFVDKRTKFLLGGTSRRENLKGEIAPSGEISIDGYSMGILRGFDFRFTEGKHQIENKSALNLVRSTIRPIVDQKLTEVATASSSGFSLSDDAVISFKEVEIARLVKGKSWLTPKIVLIGGENGSEGCRKAVVSRVSEWIDWKVSKLLQCHYLLLRRQGLKKLTGVERGFAYQVLESGGAVDLRDDKYKSLLGHREREVLREIGLRAGRYAAYTPEVKHIESLKLLAVLLTVGKETSYRLDNIGSKSFQLDKRIPEDKLAAMGYLRFGKRAIRVDIVEKLGWELSRCRKEAQTAVFEVPDSLREIVECSRKEFYGVLNGCGLVRAKSKSPNGEKELWRFRGRVGKRREAQSKQRNNRGINSGKRRVSDRGTADTPNPFSKLATLFPEPKDKRRKTAGRRK